MPCGAMAPAGSRRLLDGGKTQVIEIHNTRNPSFPEMKRPEPIRPNIDVGLKATVENNADVSAHYRW